MCIRDSYFNAPLSKAFTAGLKQQFAPLLAKQTPVAQLNSLLAWMHQSLVYQIDEQQFGREHYMHPEELALHKASDCEDRAFLLVQLITDLLALPAVGVTYPGHVAAAVALPAEHSPELPPTFVYQGKNYWLVDPTYIGAKVGDVMPQFRSLQAQVVE